MEPDNTLLSQRTQNEAYCLAESGKQYAVFFTGEGENSVQIDFGNVRRKYKLKWLDINKNKWINSSEIFENRFHVLTPPYFGTQWVAVLIR